MNLKLIFWDWMNTLYSCDILYKSRLKNLIARGCVDDSLDFQNLTFDDLIYLKSKFKNFKGCLIPFTWNLVNCFTKLGVYQVVVSNGIKSSITDELLDYCPFDLILTSESFEPKPNLEMVLYAMETLNVHDLESIIFIGDSLIDQKIAENLKVRFFKITSDYYLSSYCIAKEFDLF